MKVTRNFWTDIDIDGRRTSLSGGPASADGGFQQVVYMRAAGSTAEIALTVQGQATDGELRLTVTADPAGNAWPESMKVERCGVTANGRLVLSITSRR